MQVIVKRTIMTGGRVYNPGEQVEVDWSAEELALRVSEGLVDAAPKPVGRVVAVEAESPTATADRAAAAEPESPGSAAERAAVQFLLAMTPEDRAEAIGELRLDDLRAIANDLGIATRAVKKAELAELVIAALNG